ncbi:hypothetical protein Dimus_012922, partial [Dionaea muscipula]
LVSDHSASVVEIHVEEYKINRLFKFLNHWTMAKEYNDIVTAAWRLKFCRTTMHQLVSMQRALK